MGAISFAPVATSIIRLVVLSLSDRSRYAFPFSLSVVGIDLSQADRGDPPDTALAFETKGRSRAHHRTR